MSPSLSPWWGGNCTWFSLICDANAIILHVYFQTDECMPFAWPANFRNSSSGFIPLAPKLALLILSLNHHASQHFQLHCSQIMDPFSAHWYISCVWILGEFPVWFLMDIMALPLLGPLLSRVSVKINMACWYSHFASKLLLFRMCYQ